MSNDEGFVRRWSRLKLVVSNPPPQPVVVPEVDDEDGDDLPLAVEESPYSALLSADMPDDLRSQALRSLWRSEPVFSDSDGMTDYGDDYRAPTLEAVKSAWQAGRGYEEPAEPALAAADEDDASNSGDIS